MLSSIASHGALSASAVLAAWHMRHFARAVRHAAKVAELDAAPTPGNAELIATDAQRAVTAVASFVAPPATLSLASLPTHASTSMAVTVAPLRTFFLHCTNAWLIVEDNFSTLLMTAYWQAAIVLS